MLRTRAGPWLALALLQACSCGGGAGSPDAARPEDGGAARDAPADTALPPVDASADAGGVDRRDSAADGPEDAGGRTDAGPRGPAGWVPLPGLPEECVVERATDPAALFEAQWEPCGAGLDGCLRLADDGSLERATDPYVGYHDGSAGYFALIAEEEDDAARRRLVMIASSAGQTIGAWRGPSLFFLPADQVCMVEAQAVGPGHAAWSIETLGPDWPHEARIYHAPFEDVPETTEPIDVADRSVYPSGNSVQRLAVTGSLVAALVEPGEITALFDADGPHVLPSVPGNPEGIHAVGDDVLWEAWGSSVVVAHGSRAAGSEPYIAVDGADALGFTTDGAQMAWTQAYDRQPDGTYTRAELWTAAYVPDPAELDARRVVELPRRVIEATVGGGYYGHDAFGDWWEVRLYRLADGTALRWELPPTNSIRGPPLYITPDEVAIPIGDGVMRIAIESFEVIE